MIEASLAIFGWFQSPEGAKVIKENIDASIFFLNRLVLRYKRSIFRKKTNTKGQKYLLLVFHQNLKVKGKKALNFIEIY